MLKQARELGIKAVFAYGDGACTSEMSKLAGPASEGLICSQAGIPTQMASKSFQDAFKSKYGEVKQYAPFFYDAANILIAAMQKADSSDPAKYLPEVAKISYDGATGHIEFDDKGDRKDAEMTIFQMKSGNVEPVAIIKAGKTTKLGTEGAAAAAPASAGGGARGSSGGTRGSSGGCTGDGARRRKRRRSKRAVRIGEDGVPRGAVFLSRVSVARFAANPHNRRTRRTATGAAGSRRQPRNDSARPGEVVWTSSCSRSSTA
jgi:hypothetical protein